MGGATGLGDPFAVDRMQNLVEIRGHSESKIQGCRPNLSIFQSNSACCAGLEIVENMHKASRKLWGHAHKPAKNRAVR